MKLYKLKVLLLFVFLLAVPAAAVQAFSVQHGSAVNVAKDQTIEGNLYAAGTNVIVDGHVTGDVFCAGQAININGIVDGDVICAGQTISVGGSIGGSVRIAGSNIEIGGKIARGLTLAGANVNLATEASVGWDAMVAAANANMSGNIGRSLMGAGANFVLGGNIGKDTLLYLGNNKSKDMIELSVLDSAVLGGTLVYTSKIDASVSAKAQVKGKVTHNFPPVPKRKQTDGFWCFGMFLIAALSALVLAYVLMKIWKKPMFDMVETMTVKFWPTVGWGAILTIMAPIVAILLAITIIGFRLTLMTIWSWLILMMVSKVVAGVAIGKLLVNKYWTAKKDSVAWIVAIGIVLCWIVFYIPIIGWFASMIAMFWGAGAVVLCLKKSYDLSK